jgi:murein L,D-transpeptidase YafK
MTDQGVGEIYAIAKLALDSGQKQFQVQAYPFRMTPENLSAHRNDPNMPFWLNLYEGYRYFERTKREPTVAACGGKYVFNRNFQDGDPKDVLGACPAEKPTTPGQAITPKIAREHPLVGEVPLHANAYADGGMNESFRVLLKKFGPDKLAGRISTSRYPISRPTAALSDPFESE